MHKSFTRLSLAAALFMGAAFPVLAQPASVPAVAVPGPRATVTGSVTTPAAPLAVNPAAPVQAARPATPAPVQAARPATTPGAVQAPRPAASRVRHHGTRHVHHSASPIRPAAVRTN